ncbi:3'(2'),5'-bisphosphate nucleotidase CysQ [Campylobacter sp. JMF_01 NE2]|uniref:3'(2'),5'-bisphosphate nucleotidase CysQ family protein n=1 Tax=unclassified Campylobacter TaxID=2593542 RepID=UPI0022E99C6D|nr:MULTISPECIES: 3'(2'),5'-bisphosphate nucleotidase CysQ [unclassified Campylobacter]MDA3052273.1 3'(2'),5'-bisphosphate nucleotidase CysQ [Campylobacter sp. JMF_03 NE3]MDA3066607.1 3'(2'),5'-bisphosphate nucleotidase CysQ [Campylobacter sp. JMF_01 NE2]
MNKDELLNLAVVAAKRANKAIMEHYEKFDVYVKEDKSPLTTADLAANDAIVSTLAPSGIAICSEESVMSADERMSAKRFWLVDPLDGTKEFIARNGEFCVCIALIEDGRPILSVISSPVSGDVFSSNGGGVVYKNGAQIQRKPSSPKTFMIGHHGKGSKYMGLCEKFGFEFTRYGSALKFCVMAENGASAYGRFSDCSLWDIAAGDFIIHQSGGAIIDLKTGVAPLYNGKSLINNHYIVVDANTINLLSKMVEFAKNL